MTVQNTKFFKKRGKGFDRRGFTLIELIVAMGIFSVLIVTATSVFIRGLRTERAIASFMEVNDNASLLLEQALREMRTGKDFNKISDSEIQFTDSAGVAVGYRLQGTSLERGAEGGSGIVYGAISAESVRIKRFNIIIFGGPPLNQYPPRITISMSVGSGNPYLKNVVTNIQGTVSSRNQ